MKHEQRSLGLVFTIKTKNLASKGVNYEQLVAIR